MNSSTVRAHENGQNGVSILDLEKYARRYGVSADWLISGRGPMEQESPPSMAQNDIYPVMGVLQDGSWLEDDEESEHWPGWGWIISPEGVPEEAHYTDPRFPAELLTAMRVKSNMPDGPYPDGAIVFAADATYTGYREGDHVVVLREKGEFFYEWTLRRAVKRGSETWFEALTSDAPAFKHIPDRYIHEHFTVVLGVVVGAVVRRPVPPLPIESRRHFEAQELLRLRNPTDIPLARRPRSA